MNDDRIFLGASKIYLQENDIETLFEEIKCEKCKSFLAQNLSSNDTYS